MNRFKFKINEKVVVISGKDKGKKGTITKVLRDDNKLVVSGVNICIKHVKPSKTNPQGGRIPMESPIHASNVLHLDPKTEQAVRIGFRINDDGSKVKYSKKSKEIIAV